MLRAAPEVCVLSWILYHFRIGFERLYLFFDDPADPAASLAELFTAGGPAARGEKSVVVHRMSEEWWYWRVFSQGSSHSRSRYHASHVKSGSLGWGWDVVEAHRSVKDIPARQQICIDLAAQDAQADGLDWILHIDIDELFYLPEAECREDAPSWFARAPDDVEMVRFNNHEGVPPFEAEDWFRDVTFFRVNRHFLQPVRHLTGRWRDSTPLQSPTGSDAEEDSDVGPMDGAGVYELTKFAVVTKSSALDSAKVAQLEAGTLVAVPEVAYCREDKRLRGRIRLPPGWISILNKKTGYRWAERRAMADAPEQQQAAEATYHEGQSVEVKSWSGPFKGTWWPCRIVGVGEEPCRYNALNHFGYWPNVPAAMLRAPQAGKAKPRARRQAAAGDSSKHQKALKEILDEICKVRVQSGVDLGTSEMLAGSSTHFLGYSDGKAAARLPRDGPAPVPAFVTRFKKLRGDELRPLVRRRADGDADPVILHYANCGFSYWLSKYKMLGNFPDTVVGFQNTMKAHLASRNLVTSAGTLQWDRKSFRKLGLYYRLFVMGNEFGELPCMVSRGLVVPIHGARSVVEAALAEAAVGTRGSLVQAAQAALAIVATATERRVQAALEIAQTWLEPMLSRNVHMVWLVVARAPARCMAAPDSPVLPQQLEPSARLEHLECSGFSVRFRKLDGEGPEMGWADVVSNGREMLRLATWQWNAWGFSGAFCQPRPGMAPPELGV